MEVLKFMALKKQKGHFQINESILAVVETSYPQHIKLTQDLFNNIVMFYVSQMSADTQLFLNTKISELYSVYEKLIFDDDDLKTLNVPQDLRRAAIKKAAGVFKSWHSNFQRWLKRIQISKSAKTLQKRKRLKKKAGKPPVLPKSTNFPIQVYSAMFKDDTGESLLVKLWTGSCWQWSKIQYSCRELPVGYVKGTFSLIYSDYSLKLVWVIQKNTESKGKLVDHIKAFGTLKVLALDLNLDDPIILGKVLEGCEDTGVVVELATLRIKGNNRLNHLRKRHLGLIAKAKGQTNTHTELGSVVDKSMCRNRWQQIKNLEKEIVEQISHQIAEFAKKYDCQVIVFENLKSLNPSHKKYSLRSNIKRSNWVAKKIQKRTSTKALNRYSIYTIRVNPQFTSITNAITGDKCLRGQQVGSLNLYLWSHKGLGKLVKSPCGKIYDASENAARNIGIKYLASKFEKPMMFKPQGLEDVVISWQPSTSSKGYVVTLPSWYVLSLSNA
jgi:IS605 OrfB family transposase